MAEEGNNKFISPPLLHLMPGKRNMGEADAESATAAERQTRTGVTVMCCTHCASHLTNTSQLPPDAMLTS